MEKRFFTRPSAIERPNPDASSKDEQSNGLSTGYAILLIDDNPEIARAMRIAFEMVGHRLDVAFSPEDAFSRLAMARYDAILLDLNFSAGRKDGDEGLAFLSRIMADDPTARILVITAHSGVRIAVDAMKAGARDFIMKPWRNSELLTKVHAAIANDKGGRQAAPQAPGSSEPLLLVGDSDAIAQVRGAIRRVGPTVASVAITGRSGTGRTLVAELIHAASATSDLPLVKIDLRDPASWARLDDAEGTLLLRHADKLDEIAQAKLIDRLTARVRTIAIIDNPERLTAGLRSRLSVIVIEVPPLRDRGSDAVILARHFALVAATRYGIAAPRLAIAAERLIIEREWHDEVRGLALAIERAVFLSDGNDLQADALAPREPGTEDAQPSIPRFDLGTTEKAIISAALTKYHHNVTQAASALGLSRGALYRRIERYGL